eukprot:15462552-Alexandrium_andersonii.AAC.1
MPGASAARARAAAGPRAPSPVLPGTSAAGMCEPGAGAVGHLGSRRECSPRQRSRAPVHPARS